MSMIPDICSMYILLAAATPFEIQPVLDSREASRSGPVRHETSCLITGVGSLITAYSLASGIESRRPDLVIQAGMAGRFPIPSGDVFAIREESLADLGVWEDQGFQSVFDLKLAEKDAFPFSGGFLVNPYKKLIALTGLEPVRSITVNEITTDPIRIEWYQQNLAPVVETMEGGAFHYVCLRENIPFLQLRSVSNDIGQRDKTKWNIQSAIARLNEQLLSLLKKLDSEDESILER
jgi:futalosine hydrolase